MIQDDTNRSVVINFIGGFFTPTQTIGGVQLDLLAELRAYSDKLTDDDLRAFIILHELAHLTKVLGNDRFDPQLAKDFNKMIYERCFK